MKTRRFNWQAWLGFLVSVVAFVSYASVFVRWPATRDFPWANLLLFAIAAALLVAGVRGAWAKRASDGASAVQQSRRARMASAILAGLSVLILALFVFTAFVSSRWLPASHAAPQVGQKAPDFGLADANGNRVSLVQLLSSPINGQAPKGLLLVFYRGYW